MPLLERLVLAIQQTGHQWGIHKNPVDDDARDTDVSKRCMSMQENFNPYTVFTQVGRTLLVHNKRNLY